MSTDPTANPNPEDAPSPRPSDPTAPSFGPPQPTTPPSPQPPPPPPPPPPASASGQPYPSYGQQGPYPAPAPPPAYGGMYAGGQEHPQGTLILILGILSIVICQILGPFAWVMGRKALAEIDGSGRTYTNRTMVQAGMICGIIGSVLLILGIAYIVIVVVFVGMAATSGSVR